MGWNTTVSKIPIIFLQFILDVFTMIILRIFFLNKGRGAHLDKILLLWNGALYPLYPSWVSPSFLILLMNVNVWAHPLCWIYYTTKLHFWKKYNLTFPIGNSRVPYILESHDEKLEVLYEKDDFDRISIHTT